MGLKCLYLYTEFFYQKQQPTVVEMDTLSAACSDPICTADWSKLPS
jgi:hypothetical protein